VIPAVLDLLEHSNDEDTLDALIEGAFVYLLVGNNEAISILLERITRERDVEDDRARGTMVKLLIYISANRTDVVDAMLEVLRQDDGCMIRLEAIHALGELGVGDAREVDALLDELASEQQKDNVLEDTLYALARVGHGYPPVAAAALNILAQALTALPTLAEGETQAWMVKHLHDRNKQLRRASVYALGDVGIASPPIIAALEQRLNEDPHTGVRITAAEALNKLGIKGEHIITVLKEIIADEKSEIWRNDAIKLLAEIAPAREDVQQILYELAQSVQTNPIHNTAFLRLYKAVIADVEIHQPN
jgi:HEAT repeat protein